MKIPDDTLHSEDHAVLMAAAMITASSTNSIPVEGAVHLARLLLAQVRRTSPHDYGPHVPSGTPGLRDA